MTHPIDKAAQILGSQHALARALGVTKAAVWQWKEKGRRIPAEHCPAIERMTGVRCEELRPDVDWAVLRGSSAANAAAAPKLAELARTIQPVTASTAQGVAHA